MDLSYIGITAVGIWGYLGLAVAIAFLVVGIDRVDENARGAYAFRPLLIPGILVLWPLVAWRWYNLERGVDPWRKWYLAPVRAHGLIAIVLLVLLPGILIGSLALRQTWPDHLEPLLVEPASGEVR